MRFASPVFFRAIVGLAAAVAFSSVARATLVSYGTLAGANVTYTNVTENDSQFPPPDPDHLFGNPSLSVDTLQFLPQNSPKGLAFKLTVGGGSPGLQDGTLGLGIVPTNPAGGITSISINEGGGYAVTGGTSATQVSAALNIANLFITSVNGNAVNPIAVAGLIESFSRTSGTGPFVASPNSIVFSGSGGANTGTWAGTANYSNASLVAALTGAGFSGSSRITGLTLSLDNVLSGTSEASSVANIDKKFFNITTTTVPEPATVVLAGLGAIGLAAGYRRRNR
jgi:PEP-CTERM motif